MRLGVLASIHEDVIRLEQAVDVLRQTGCETILCLGDIVGYSVPYYGFLKSRDAHRAVTWSRGGDEGRGGCGIAGRARITEG